MEVFAKGREQEDAASCHYPVTSLLKSSMIPGPVEVTRSAQGLKWPKDPEETADIFSIARRRGKQASCTLMGGK